MASPTAERPKLHASDILSLSEADLDELLRKSIPVGGDAATCIDGVGLEKLSQGEQLSGVQRIRYQRCPMALLGIKSGRN